MGTVETQPEPLIEHLRKGPGQPWEHWWRQSVCVTRRGGGGRHGCTSLKPLLRADCHWWRISGWRSIPCGVFPGKSRSSEMGEHSFPLCPFCHFTLVSPFYRTDLSNCNRLEGTKWLVWRGAVEMRKKHVCVLCCIELTQLVIQWWSLICMLRMTDLDSEVLMIRLRLCSKP